MNREIGNEKNCFNQQSDWLSQVDKVNDTEAAQVNGGYSSYLAALQKIIEAQNRLTVQNALAQAAAKAAKAKTAERVQRRQ